VDWHIEGEKMRSFHYINLKIWIIPIVGLILAVISLTFLPDQIPIRWDSAGNVQTASRYTILLLPAISIAVLVLGHVVPVIDPKKKEYASMAREYTIIHLLVMLLLLAFEAFIIVSSLGVPISGSMFAYLVAGALFCAIGNYLPKLPPTYLTGIKTVWGYKDDAVWVKVHRFGGRLWFFGGLVLMALAFVPVSFPVNLVVIAVLVIAPRLYGMSISIHRK
jgi:uncharacterized membrane protein